VLPVSERAFLGGYTRTEGYVLRVLYADRIVELRHDGLTGPVLAAAREGLGISLEDRGFEVIPPDLIDPTLRGMLARRQDQEPPAVQEVADALGADLLLFAWTDQYEQNRGLTGIQRAHFSLALHLVDPKTGKRLWVKEDRRTSGYEVGESFGDYVEFVKSAARQAASGTPRP